MNRAEGAMFLGVSQWKFAELVKKHCLSTRVISGVFLVRMKDAEALLEKLNREKAEPPHYFCDACGKQLSKTIIVCLWTLVALEGMQELGIRRFCVTCGNGYSPKKANIKDE
jgi:hypothetical protein